jgi:hypothetical protein
VFKSKKMETLCVEWKRKCSNGKFCRFYFAITLDNNFFELNILDYVHWIFIDVFLNDCIIRHAMIIHIGNAYI